MRLFCYGTLMIPAVWQRVVGRGASACDALLKNYERRRMQGKAYPGLVRKAGAQTRGVVYQQLNEHDLRRLDRYEGRQYKRVRVSVCLSDDNVVCSWCYVTRARYTNLLGREYWSLRDFVDNDLQTYLRRI